MPRRSEEAGRALTSAPYRPHLIRFSSDRRRSSVFTPVASVTPTDSRDRSGDVRSDLFHFGKLTKMEVEVEMGVSLPVAEKS